MGVMNVVKSLITRARRTVGAGEDASRVDVMLRRAELISYVVMGIWLVIIGAIAYWLLGRVGVL